MVTFTVGMTVDDSRVPMWWRSGLKAVLTNILLQGGKVVKEEEKKGLERIEVGRFSGAATSNSTTTGGTKATRDLY